MCGCDHCEGRANPVKHGVVAVHAVMDAAARDAQVHDDPTERTWRTPAEEDFERIFERAFGTPRRAA